MSELRATEIEDVYTPDEIQAIHRRPGWTNYIASSAHCERLAEASRKACDARYLEYIKELSSRATAHSSGRPMGLGDR